MGRRFAATAVVASVVALIAICCASCRPVQDRDTQPPIIIIIPDALRHDYASMPGYAPHGSGMQRLRAAATTFDKCVTTVGTTRGSFPGFFSGQLTGSLDENARRSSWIAALRGAGYRTTFIASSYAFGTEKSAVDVMPLFDDVFLENTPGRIARPMPEAVALLDRVLGQRKSDRVLVVLHLFYPHAPYWQISFGESVTQLDGEIAKAMAVLQKHGVYENAHVILTSDHGETLQEHGSPPQHGWTVYGEETRIPLIWKTPRQAEPRLVRDLVRNYDIGPTLTAAVGLPIDTQLPESRAGIPIAAIVGGRHTPRVAFHAALTSRMYPVPQIGLRTDRHLLVQSSEGLPSSEVYEYATDPAERYNLADSDDGRAVIRDLAPKLAELKTIWINTELEKRDGLNEEMRRTLQSLGYLGTGPSSAQRTGGLQAEPLPGLRARFVECFSRRWSRSAGDSYDSLYPIRLAAAGPRLFVTSNATREISRLYPTSGRVRQTVPQGEQYEEVWFQRRNHQIAGTARGELLVLLDNRRVKRYYADPNDYRLDSDGHTFTQMVAELDDTYEDLLDARERGLVLFKAGAVYLRSRTGRTELLARYSSDAHRTAYSESDGEIYIADGRWIFRVSPGTPPVLFKDVGARVLSIAIRGNELWVGTHPFPPADENRSPLLVYDRPSGKKIGSFGARVVREDSNFWTAIDVGPFGIAFPSQIVFAGNRMYVLDTGLERILSFDLR